MRYYLGNIFTEVMIFNLVERSKRIMEEYKRAEMEVVEFEASDVLRATL